MILIAFESSGTTRDAFINAGFDAWSCDLLPGRGQHPHRHLQCDVRDVINFAPWHFMLAHPTCTYLCGSGWHWNHKRHGRHAVSLYWLDFVRLLMSAPIHHIAIENPIGAIGTHIDARQYGFSHAKASQYIQPYEYGHDASKRTGLWLKNLPALVPESSNYISPRVVTHNGKLVERWGNQTDSGQNRLGPSEHRWSLRSETYQGWSTAMVEQWGEIIVDSSVRLRHNGFINYGDTTT